MKSNSMKSKARFKRRSSHVPNQMQMMCQIMQMIALGLAHDKSNVWTRTIIASSIGIAFSRLQRGLLTTRQRNRLFDIKFK